MIDTLPYVLVITMWIVTPVHHGPKKPKTYAVTYTFPQVYSVTACFEKLEHMMEIWRPAKLGAKARIDCVATDVVEG